MGWHVTVRKLKDMLERFDDSAIVMLGDGERDENDVITYELDEDPSYAYRNNEGEVFTDEELKDDESVARAQRVVILWPIKE